MKYDTTVNEIELTVRVPVGALLEVDNGCLYEEADLIPMAALLGLVREHGPKMCGLIVDAIRESGDFSGEVFEWARMAGYELVEVDAPAGRDAA